MKVDRTLTLSFVVSATQLIEEWLEKHSDQYESCRLSVNAAMVDNTSLDVILKISPKRVRVLRVALRLRHHIHDVTLRMGSYEIDTENKPIPKVNLANVLGKAQFQNTWNFQQQFTSDMDESGRAAKILQTVTANLQSYLLDPYPVNSNRIYLLP